MRNEDSDYSCLKTVSAFDNGNASTIAVDLGPQELQNFSPSSLLVESLIEQLCKLMEKNPKNQKKLYNAICEKLHQMNLIDETYNMDEFSFMRTHYQKALYQLLSMAKHTTNDNKAICPSQKINVPRSPPSQFMEWSRYSSEFIQKDFIARGGFGQVYKAQHKLDGSNYAVKKIYIRFESINDFVENLKEVKTLAKLHHPNIVAYKAAWLEPVTSKKSTTAITESRTSTKEDSLEVIFEDSNGEVSKSSSQSPREEEECSEYSSSVTNDGVVCEYINNYNFQYSRRKSRVVGSPCATLFIQMQLCHQTLRQWLDLRNDHLAPLNIEHALHIFRQVVKGVEYIHSQGIVHHDIKPSNIFLSSDMREVQVGDFGLACRLIGHPSSSLSVITSVHQPGQLGTKLYAAPEQLSGVCHAKSDVYSLGIVLFELIHSFNTAMERSKVISQLRSGHIPTELAASYPHLVQLISSTVVTSLKKRPTSSVLVEMLQESDSTNTLRLLAEQGQTIDRLRKESLAKDAEIASLKQRLKEILEARAPS